jgi:hypothetical protein
MNTRRYSYLMVNIFCIVFTTSFGCKYSKKNPPNVLLIMIDDLNDCIETLGGQQNDKKREVLLILPLLLSLRILIIEF